MAVVIRGGKRITIPSVQRTTTRIGFKRALPVRIAAIPDIRPAGVTATGQVLARSEAQGRIFNVSTGVVAPISMKSHPDLRRALAARTRAEATPHIQRYVSKMAEAERQRGEITREEKLVVKTPETFAKRMKRSVFRAVEKPARPVREPLGFAYTGEPEQWASAIGFPASVGGGIGAVVGGPPGAVIGIGGGALFGFTSYGAGFIAERMMPEILERALTPIPMAKERKESIRRQQIAAQEALLGGISGQVITPYFKEILTPRVPTRVEMAHFYGLTTGIGTSLLAAPTISVVEQRLSYREALKQVPKVEQAAFKRWWDLTKGGRADLPIREPNFAIAKNVTRKTAYSAQRFVTQYKEGKVVSYGSVVEKAQIPGKARLPQPNDIDLAASNPAKFAKDLTTHLTSQGRNVRLQANPSQQTWRIYETVGGRSLKAIEVHPMARLYANIDSIRGPFETRSSYIVQTPRGMNVLKLKGQLRREIVAGIIESDVKRVARWEKIEPVLRGKRVEGLKPTKAEISLERVKIKRVTTPKSIEDALLPRGRGEPVGVPRLVSSTSVRVAKSNLSYGAIKVPKAGYYPTTPTGVRAAYYPTKSLLPKVSVYPDYKPATYKPDVAAKTLWGYTPPKVGKAIYPFKMLKETAYAYKPPSVGRIRVMPPYQPPKKRAEYLPPYKPPKIARLISPPYKPPTKRRRLFPPYTPPTYKTPKIPPYKPPVATFPRITPPYKPPVGWKWPKKEKLKFKPADEFGFVPFGRRRGKWFPLSKVVLGKQSAFRLGSKWARESLGVSFKLKEVRGRPMRLDLPAPPLGMFRKPIRKGQLQMASSIWIEKRRFRLDVPSEVGEIQTARMARNFLGLPTRKTKRRKKK